MLLLSSDDTLPELMVSRFLDQGSMYTRLPTGIVTWQKNRRLSHLARVPQV